MLPFKYHLQYYVGSLVKCHQMRTRRAVTCYFPKH